MIQMLCDRCGEVVGDDRDPNAATGRRVTTASGSFLRYDLCDPCIEALKAWVAGE